MAKKPINDMTDEELKLEQALSDGSMQFGLPIDGRTQFGMPVEGNKPFDAGITQTPTSTPTTEPAISDAQYKDLSDIYNKILEQQKKYDNEVSKERRKSRGEMAIAGISDATSALANLIATRHYAPSANDGSTPMSDKARERYERAKAELDKDNAAKMQYLQRLAADKYKSANLEQGARRLKYYEKESERKANQQSDKNAYNKARMELERLKAENLAQYRKDIAEGKDADRALKRYMAETARINALQKASDITEDTEYKYDVYGNLIEKTTSKTKQPAGDSQSTTSSTGNSSNGKKMKHAQL